jgi:hypothetical protein
MDSNTNKVEFGFFTKGGRFYACTDEAHARQIVGYGAGEFEFAKRTWVPVTRWHDFGDYETVEASYETL